MKKVKYLGELLGAYSTTDYNPMKVYEPSKDKEKLKEKTTKTWTSSDWRLVEVPRYKVLEIEIPDWMSPEEYLDTHTQIGWKYYKIAGGAEKLGREAFKKLSWFKDKPLLVAVLRLLKTKRFRSKFRESLRDQVLDWIEGKSKYDSPLSKKQRDALVTRADEIFAKKYL